MFSNNFTFNNDNIEYKNAFILVQGLFPLYYSGSVTSYFLLLSSHFHLTQSPAHSLLTLASIPLFFNTRSSHLNFFLSCFVYYWSYILLLYLYQFLILLYLFATPNYLNIFILLHSSSFLSSYSYFFPTSSVIQNTKNYFSHKMKNTTCTRFLQLNPILCLKMKKRTNNFK